MNAYIKAQKSLRHSPKILQISAILGISTKHAIGLVINCWMFADDYADGENRVYDVTKATLDKDAEIEGFANALISVGWLEVSADYLEFPFYLEKNDTSESIRKEKKKKVQEQNRLRQKRRREKLKAEQLDSHNSTQDLSQNVTRDRSVTEALHERDRSVTEALHPNGHYNTNNTNTETDTQQSVTSKTIDEHSDENLAQEWCFRCKRKKNRRCADDVFDITSEISALTEDLKIDRQFLLREIKNPERDRSEYFWQFKKRVFEFWKSQQSTNPAEPNGKRKITSLLQLRKALEAGEIGNG